MPDPEAPPADRRAAFLPGTPALAAAVALVLSATTVVLAQLDTRTGTDYQVHTLLLGSDLALLALVAVSAGRVSAGRIRAALSSWRHHACALGGLAIVLAMVPALVASPTDRGGAAVLRLAGAAVLALTLGSAQGDGRRLVLGAVAAVTLAHVAVALAQRAAGGPIGLGAIGESSAYEIGRRYASTGLTVHPYVLAAWCTVAGTALLALGARRAMLGRLARVAGVASFGGIGLTMSRAGVAAGVLALGALAVAALRASDRAGPLADGRQDGVQEPDVALPGGSGDTAVESGPPGPGTNVPSPAERSSPHGVPHPQRACARAGRWTVAAAALALSLGVVLNLSGWASRAGQEAGSVDALSSGRGALLRQAWPLLSENPLVGVGPGNYVLALSERPDLVALSTQSPRPVHLTPLLLVVEGGLLAVPALAALALAIGRACRRGGAVAVAVTLAMVPFLALDHLAWSYPQGILLTGIWLGVLDLLSRRPATTP